MKSSAKQYFLTFYRFARSKVSLLIFVAAMNAVLEGAVLLLMVPFFYIARAVSGSMQFDMPFNLGFMEGLADKKYSLIILLCVFVLVSIAQEYVKRYMVCLSTFIRSGFNRNLSDNLYKAFAKAKWSALLSKRRSDIANALSNELKMIDMGTQIMLQLAPLIPVLVVQLVICAFISFEGTLAAIVVGGLFFLFLRPVNKKLGTFCDNQREG